MARKEVVKGKDAVKVGAKVAEERVRRSGVPQASVGYRESHASYVRALKELAEVRKERPYAHLILQHKTPQDWGTWVVCAPERDTPDAYNPSLAERMKEV